MPIVVVLYIRRELLLNLLDSLPSTTSVEVAKFAYVIDTGEATAVATTYPTRLAFGVAQATPELAAHATVFAFVVFGVLLGRPRIRRALLLPIPSDYHDVPQALHERTRGALFALYVIQAATSFGTSSPSRCSGCSVTRRRSRWP